MTASLDPAAHTWLLLAADGGVLAELEIYGGDQPWLHCHFRPQPRFGFVAKLFADERRILEANGPFDSTAWENAYDRIRALRLQLQRAAGGHQTRQFILHVDGDHAWFRVPLR